ncbi:hypothetical protein L9F63_006390, partial [Diploptera punctata]
SIASTILFVVSTSVLMRGLPGVDGCNATLNSRLAASRSLAYNNCLSDDDVDEFGLMIGARDLNRGRKKIADDFDFHPQVQNFARLNSRSDDIGKAKNVIMFLGDGMSLSTLAATRAYLGQMEGRPGEETVLSFEEFPTVGLSKTYCIDSQVADSACSATAYLGGVKANMYTIGVNGRVNLNDCEAMLNSSNHVTSILQWSQEAGKSTGIVTTTRITHASPSGTYAHIANRNWEGPEDIISAGLNPARCPSIAQQLIKQKPGRDMQVIFGGGLSKFQPTENSDEDLIEYWKNEKAERGAKYSYVTRRNELNQLDIHNTDYALGLFNTDHLPYTMQADPEIYPSLEEMTRSALKILKKNERGFFLFVEGGRIDHAHHSTKAHLALDETVEFAKAIQAAVEMTDERETLIVVTSDHGHTMTISGYPTRGNDIFGIAGTSSDDGFPYATLSYANGLGYKVARYDLTEDDMADPDYLFPATVPLYSETHDGTDVGIFARGPWSHLFTGVMEQHVIPHLMAFASCVGNGFTAYEGTTSSCYSCFHIAGNEFHTMFVATIKCPNALFWTTGAQETLRHKLSRTPLKGKAKNVILFLGDGMSISTLTASRAYLGQMDGFPGEETVLPFEKFPTVGLSKTYCVDSQVPDSACTSTAYLGGVKGNIGTIGVNGRVKKNDCEAMVNSTHHVSSILHWSQEAGKSTGIVTTTRVTHASPAGTYAHTANRRWESPEDIICAGLDPKKCPSIAQQLCKDYIYSCRFHVIFGGGRSKLLPSIHSREDLIKYWKNEKDKRGVKYRYISRKKDLSTLDIEDTDYVLGLFKSSHLKYKLQDNEEKYPSLEEMTKTAINILKKNENGFFLFVE